MSTSTKAKTHLSRLLEEAVRGEPFIIAKAGKPLVTVTRIEDSSAPRKSRLGFAAGRYKVPDKFDSWCAMSERTAGRSGPDIGPSRIVTAKVNAATGFCHSAAVEGR